MHVILCIIVTHERERGRLHKNKRGRIHKNKRGRIHKNKLLGDTHVHNTSECVYVSIHYVMNSDKPLSCDNCKLPVMGVG